MARISQPKASLRRSMRIVVSMVSLDSLHFNLRMGLFYHRGESTRQQALLPNIAVPQRHRRTSLFGPASWKGCLHHANLSGLFSQRFHGIQRQPVAFMQRCFILNRCTTDFILVVRSSSSSKASSIHSSPKLRGLSCERDEDSKEEEEQHGSHGHAVLVEPTAPPKSTSSTS